MKKHLYMLLLAALGVSATATAENVSRTFFIDFGDVQPERGRVTEGADENGNWWNNVKSSGNNYVYPGTKVDLVTSANEATDCSIMVNVRFMTNGRSAGGLMTPSAEKLGDLAVATATEDYLFVEDFQDYNFFTFKGLDVNRAYRFHAFGSRANDQTRIGNYWVRGLNDWDEDHQMAGVGCGADGYNGNNNHISISDPIFPDENGEITFTIRRVTAMTHINAMKIEEIDDVERPDNFTLTQSMYIDFGEHGNDPDRGQKSEGADVNGNYWNNFYGTEHEPWIDRIPAGTSVALVNSKNEPSGITATTSDYLLTNGGVNGGMNDPKADDLRDLAVTSATGDYVYVELSQPSVSVEFTGVDPNKAYRVHAFGSRATNETGDRWGYYRVDGSTSWRIRQDFSGRCIGGKDENGADRHGNTRNVAVSDYIYPDANGKLIFTIERMTGLSHLNLIKLEEFASKEAPKPEVNVMSLSVTGSAVEDGGDMAMMPLWGSGVYNGKFECYMMLKPGSYTFSGVTSDGETVALGMTDGQLVVDGTAIDVTDEQLVRLTADTRNHTLAVLPIENLTVKGVIVPNNTTVEYAGRGVWRSTVTLDKQTSVEYINRNIYFAFNNDEALAVKRVAGTDDVVLPSQGGNGENIRLNNGTYELTVDMANRKFAIDAEINPYRVSVFGSSVANGQGATNFQGYAYLYGQQLEKRTASGLSEYPLQISGVSIGGNTTSNLLARYDDMIHDFGRYVMIGLSLGNEGVHGSADQERVFNGFRDNMLKLIADMRADGKVPVVVNNYTRGDYDDSDYGWVKRMNMLIHEWDLPSVNVLGAIDDGAGHWASGFIADVAHPNYAGHQEFMYAIVPSLFDALVDGKPLPERDMTKTYKLENGTVLAFTHEGTLHAFTLNVKVKGNAAGRLMKFEHGARKQYTGSLTVNGDGSLTYNSPLKDAVTTAAGLIGNDDWHDVALTHYYAWGRTFVSVDGVRVAEVSEKLTPGEMLIGDDENNVSREIAEIAFWRAGMTEEELKAHHDGRMMKSSLEIYSPMEVVDGKVVNNAQSFNEIEIREGELSGVETAEADGDSLRVEGGKGVAVIYGRHDASVSVYGVDGRKVAVVEHVAPVTEVALSAGIYVIEGAKVVVI